MNQLFSSNILSQIGSLSSREEDNATRASLNISQLLDLLAWFDIFGENGCIIKEYPHIWKSVMKDYFEQRPDLTQNQIINFESQKGMEWAKAQVKQFQHICEQEFLSRVCTQSDEFFDNIYTSKHSQYRHHMNGQMVSSLCGDVFTIISVQLHTIQDHVSPYKKFSRDLLCEAASIIFIQLRSKQTQYRDEFLHSLDSAIAASNDFIRLSEQCEESMETLKQTLILRKEEDLSCFVCGDLTDESKNDESGSSSSNDIEMILDDSVSDLLSIYSIDAVYAAQSLHLFVLEPIIEEIGPKLFSHEWEEMSTHNQEALSIVETIEDFWSDIKKYLDPLLLPKAMDAILTAIVSFYIKTLITRANQHKSDTQPYWTNEARTLDRMEKDITILQDFFLKQHCILFPEKSKSNPNASPSNHQPPISKPSLSQTAENEFKILHIIKELVGVAFGTARPKPHKTFKSHKSSAESENLEKRSTVEEASHLVLFLHQHIRREDLTQRLAGDLWHLAAPQKEYKIWQHLKHNIQWSALTPIPITEEKLVKKKKKESRKKSKSPQDPRPSENDIVSRMKPGTLLNLSSMLDSFYKNNHRKIPKKDNAVKKVKRRLTPVPKVIAH